jgi:hypothetical protein
MRVGKRDVLFVVVIVISVLSAGAGLWRVAGSTPRTFGGNALPSDELRPIVAIVDQAFHDQWSARGAVPARRASDLAVMRRLSLGLCGTIPSLEEIRRFESQPAGARLEAWLEELLHDRRFADYFAERFARAFVGTEDGPFLVFRRRRFIAWLSDAILANRPYRAIIRELIADQGLWTDHPATNFLTVTFDQEAGRPSPERLGARVARAFLGVRLDCASCHDHPFQHWKQADFQGLAAFFGGVHSDLRGIRDDANDYRPPDRKAGKPACAVIEPRVPFLSELRSASGSPRDQLADWVVHPRNGYFARETVNRVWALFFGRPLAEPIDDLPAVSELHPALVRLAEDFSSHGTDLHRLIRIIAATEVFRLDSATDSEAILGPEETWAIFPMTRLRPDQVAGAIFQAGSLRTVDAQSHWFVRLVSYTGRNDFVRRYGDTGEDEFDGRGGTIPQRLLLMNGQVVRGRTKDDFFTAASQIAELAPDDDKAVLAAFLTALTRRPNNEESKHFATRLTASSGKERKAQLADLFWSLLNTTEFSWNH